MGIRDAILGRRFSKKFKDLLEEALAELEYSKPDFEEISRATSRVTKLLKDEKHQHENAYRKVNIVIRKQNHLDACNIIIGYLRLLIDNIDSFKPKSDIPEEHLETVSSLIFAAPRIRLASCFTAIQDVRKFLLSHFGQNLAVQYLEIRNNCWINPQLTEKLAKEPSPRDVRMKLLEEIAAKENIVLKLGEASTSREGTSDKAELASEERVQDETRKGCELSERSGKKKIIDVADADKAVGSSSNGPENKQPEQEKKGNNDGSAKGGKTKQKRKDKQADATEKTLGNSSNGPENNKSEQEGNGDSSIKRGKTKQNRKDKLTDVDEKALGSPSNGPENEKSEHEQEGSTDVRLEPERRVVSESEEISNFIEEWLEKDIEIDWSVAGDVDHMVEETAVLKHPLSVRNRRVPQL